MHRMRWPSLFICCGGDQLSPAGKYLSSCHSETSPQTGRGNPHFLAVDAQVPSSEWERQRVCCCVNSLFRRSLDHSSCTPGRKCRNLGFCWLFCLLFQLLGKVGRRRHVPVEVTHRRENPQRGNGFPRSVCAPARNDRAIFMVIAFSSP